MNRTASTSVMLFATAAIATTASGVSAASSSPLQPVRTVLVDQGATHQSIPMPLPNHIQYELWPDATKRLRFLATLNEDHDGEGALEPSHDSILSAISFVEQLPFYAPDPVVGLDDEGHAVVEFHDGVELGQLIFRADGTVEAFYSQTDGEPVSFEGSADDGEFHSQFVQTFGFRFAA
ncbi:hypothetical protein HFO97_01210 [Rhizobium leguminosarum]|uniref:hypothetical protein n=1 Tax=Rhizobium leguminosarum TaxID=384 RepID=UPI001C94FA86|nr:hypothetical protein [Rhizobium leguminosarum]MBY5358635.1 hypothetical protein [Rhizobium leguminosarum]